MEIVGRLLMTIVLMGLAFGIGFICALAVFFLLRRANRPWQRPLLVAFLFPPAAMGYLLVCMIVSSALSTVLGTPDLVFGDINEPLPNGFYLRALDKMPEAGRIEKAQNDLAGVAWVSDVQIAGPLVIGRYNYTCFSRTEEEKSRNLFLFDTRNGTTRDFAAESDLAIAADTSIHLTPTPLFRGPRTAYQRISGFLLLLAGVAPPLAAGTWLISQLRCLTKRRLIDPQS